MFDVEFPLLDLCSWSDEMSHWTLINICCLSIFHSSRVILDSYLKQAVELSESGTGEGNDQNGTIRRCRTHFRLAHYADALYRSHQERLMSNEWQAALRLRHHKVKEDCPLSIWNPFWISIPGDAHLFSTSITQTNHQKKSDPDGGQIGWFMLWNSSQYGRIFTNASGLKR